MFVQILSDHTLVEKLFTLMFAAQCQFQAVTVNGISFLSLMIFPVMYRSTRSKRSREVFGHFKSFVSAMQNERGPFTVKTLVSDNGGEYFSQDFKIYLKEKGITHLTSPPYSPQQN